MLEHEQRVQITVAAVRYNCLGRDRTGVASVQLSDRLKVCALLHTIDGKKLYIICNNHIPAR